jgi:hypothetical protein
VLKGTIAILDVQYGNLWTNIPADLFNQLHIPAGGRLRVTLYYKGRQVYLGYMPFAHTFGEVPLGQPLAYQNSLMQLSFALNQGSFAAKYHIESGSDWSVEVMPAPVAGKK